MEFQPEKESWDSYAERLEHFFKAANIVDDEKKVFTLIHQNGPSLYTLLKELSFPSNPTLMSYDDVKEFLKRHYVGTRNVFYERKVFYRARMKPFESASDWHRRLKGLVINCNFGGFIEEILVDKFVTGFHGKVLHRLYEQDETLSLQQALEIAQRYENNSTFVGKAKGGNDKAGSESRQWPQQHHVVQENHHLKQQQEVQQQQQKVQQQHQVQQPQQVQQMHQQQKVQQMHQKQQVQQNYHQQQQRQPQQQQGYQQQQQQGYQQLQQQGYQQQQQPQQQLQIRVKTVPTCYKCGRVGHYANVCRFPVQQEDRCCIS